MIAYFIIGFIIGSLTGALITAVYITDGRDK